MVIPFFQHRYIYSTTEERIKQKPLQEVIMLKLYMPERAVFTSTALGYEMGRNILKYLELKGVEIARSPVSRIKSIIPGKTPKQAYSSAKKTLLVTTTRAKKLDVCRPSADWQFNLVAGCPGHCEYCYLQTTHGEKPYLKLYVNLQDIFDVILEYIRKKNGKTATFEAASLGDPLSLEHISGALAKTIGFFAGLDKGRLRVVTKYDNVDSLLDLDHNRHTHFRVSINSRYVINTFEHGTSTLDERAEASAKLSTAGYPTGFVIAPIMIYGKWKEEYRELMDVLHEKMGAKGSGREITFELIQYRFTENAKSLILERFPNTRLDMDETGRRLKWGKFGRFKYIYSNDESAEIRRFMTELINERFPNAVIEYFT